MRDHPFGTAVLLGKRAQILRSAALPPTVRGVPPPARLRAARQPEERLPYSRALGAGREARTPPSIFFAKVIR
jgi:hypothetical protein